MTINCSNCNEAFDSSAPESLVLFQNRGESVSPKTCAALCPGCVSGSLTIEISVDLGTDRTYSYGQVRFVDKAFGK